MRKGRWGRESGAGLAPLRAACLTLWVVSASIALIGDAPAWGQEVPATQGANDPASAWESDGPAFEITEFEISYVHERNGLPSIEELMQTEIGLGRVRDGFVAPRGARPAVMFRLADADKQTTNRYYASALRSIYAQLHQVFARRGLIGIYVAAHGEDLFQGKEPNDIEDVRPAERNTMRIQILVGAVTEMRTLASGTRIPPELRTNNPAHTWILERSPVRPEADANLLRKQALDEYVFRLNRQPSRRVDVAIASAEEPGGVALDYLVSEVKPWMVYAQISNTGTEQTSDWRQRFGLVNNQLSGRDDILSIDFVTAGFEDSNAALVSYEAPVFNVEPLRWKAYATWSEFTASDIGLADADFEGEEYSFGGELIWNAFQARELFIDLVGGLRFKHIETDNAAASQEGEADFWQPYGGLRMERITGRYRTEGSLILTYASASDEETRTSAGTGGSVEDSLDGLGRQDPDDEWWVAQGSLEHSFFLEPVLYPKGDYTTLAHEVLFVGRAQYAFGNRLVPQEQDVLGGLYTVRGYPESVVAADTVLLGTVEYRYHVPRGFKPEPARKVFGREFRRAPEQEFGLPDWDLVLKGFFDIGRAMQSDALDFETDNTLMGAGVGIELQFKQNISLRLDYGVALRNVEDEIGDDDVEAGEDRLHVLFTISY